MGALWTIPRRLGAGKGQPRPGRLTVAQPPPAAVNRGAARLCRTVTNRDMVEFSDEGDIHLNARIGAD